MDFNVVRTIKETLNEAELSDYESTQEICSKCQGRKIISTETVHLLTICPKCNGHGTVDWIDHATGNPSRIEANNKILQDVTLRNAERLALKIKESFYAINTEVRVTLEIIYNGYDTYQMGEPFEKRSIQRGRKIFVI